MFFIIAQVGVSAGSRFREVAILSPWTGAVVISYFEHRVLSVSGRPTGPKKLMSELQTEREFNVDAGCSVVITSLSGEELLKREITETTRLTLLEEELKRDVIQSAATSLNVPEKVFEVSGTCKLLWHELSSANLHGQFCLGAIRDEEYGKVVDEMQDVHRKTNPESPETCNVCFGPCEDADHAARLANCVRCMHCFLCPSCKVYIQPVCYKCINWREDTLEVPDDTLKRIHFLIGGEDPDDDSSQV